MAIFPARSDHQGVGDADRLGGDHDGEKVMLVRDSRLVKTRINQQSYPALKFLPIGLNVQS